MPQLLLYGNNILTQKWNSFKAKEKYRGMFETQKSGNKTSSGEIGLDISFIYIEHMQVPKWDRTRCPEE